MRFKWQRRADEAHLDRLRAERKLALAEAKWPEVNRQADALRRHKELNGWTGIAAALFADQRRR